MIWHVYLVRAGDGTLYTGIATDVERRLAEHDGEGGKGAKYLRGRGPCRLEYAAAVGERALALTVEHRVKKLSRAGKARLIEAAPDTAGLFAMLNIDRPIPD